MIVAVIVLFLFIYRHYHVSVERLGQLVFDSVLKQGSVIGVLLNSALQMNYLIILSVMRHPCLYSEHCKLAAACFNVIIEINV